MSCVSYKHVAIFHFMRIGTSPEMYKQFALCSAQEPSSPLKQQQKGVECQNGTSGAALGLSTGLGLMSAASEACAFALAGYHTSPTSSSTNSTIALPVTPSSNNNNSPLLFGPGSACSAMGSASAGGNPLHLSSLSNLSMAGSGSCKNAAALPFQGFELVVNGSQHTRIEPNDNK